jgi:hypothetical protein
MGMTRRTESRAAVEHSPQRAKATAWQASSQSGAFGPPPTKNQTPPLLHGGVATQKMLSPFILFAEDFFNIADFSFDFAGNLFRRSTVPQIGVPDRFPGLFFDFPGNFFGRAFHFVLCA